MPQTYRLRLGDGTILLVDHDGLSTWETDRTAAVGTKNPNKWIPLKEFLVQERAAAFRRAREEATRDAPPAEAPPAEAPVPLREDGLPLVPPPPPREDGSDRLDLPSPPQGEALSPPTPPHDVMSLALPAPTEEPTPDRDAVPEDLFVPEQPRPLAPLPRDAEEGDSAAALPDPAEPASPAPIAEDTGPEVPATEPAPPIPIAEEIDLKVLAAESMVPSPVLPPPPATADLPVIPLKALEDDAPARPATPSLPVQPLADDPSSTAGAPSLRARAPDDDPTPDEPVRLPGLVVVAIQWTAVLGAVLSRGLAPINRLDQGLPLFGVDVPSPPLESRAAAGDATSLPTFDLNLDAVRARTSIALRELPDRTRGWLAGLTSLASGLAPRELPGRTRGWLDGFTSRVWGPGHREHPQPTPVPPGEPTAPPPPISAPTETRQPPPVATELPVLRLAPVHEPPPVGDVYAGDEAESVGWSSAWLWTRRFFLTATVLAGGTFVALHRDAWSSGANDLGGTVFTEIHERVRWMHLARERQAVIDQASEQLPHLARDTVGLVVSSSPAFILEPPGVFETAWGAAERGASTLTATELQELEGLTQELLDRLRPLDRERLSTFGRAYAQGAVFPFDARRGLVAYARGARALPPERRERLQALLGKAVAAGLAS